MITMRDLKLNDIILEKKTYNEIEQYVKNEIKRSNTFQGRHRIIDPKKILKEAKTLRTVDTLVSDSELRVLL